MARGGEGRGGREAARGEGVGTGSPALGETSPPSQRKSAHPPPAVTTPNPHLAGAAHPGRKGRKEGAGPPFLYSLARASARAGAGLHPGRRAQWLKAPLFGEVALPARPGPSPARRR